MKSARVGAWNGTRFIPELSNGNCRRPEAAASIKMRRLHVEPTEGVADENAWRRDAGARGDGSPGASEHADCHGLPPGLDGARRLRGGWVNRHALACEA